MGRVISLLLLAASVSCGVPRREPDAVAPPSTTSSIVEIGDDLDGVLEVAQPHVGQAFRASVPEQVELIGSTQGLPVRLRVDVTGQAAVEQEVDGYAVLHIGLRPGDVLATRVIGGSENGMRLQLRFAAMTSDSPGVSVEQQAFAVVSRGLAPAHLFFAGDPCFLSLLGTGGRRSTKVAAGGLRAVIDETNGELVLSCADGESCMALRTAHDCGGVDDVEAGRSISVPLAVRERFVPEARRQVLDAFMRLSSRCAGR